MATDFEKIYSRLFEYCERRDFAGHDPFDGLNSRVFQMLPIRNIRAARFAFSQIVKRSPINLRSLLGVPPGRNAKGLALFALAELSRYRTTDDNRHLDTAEELVRRMMELKITGDTASGRQTLAFGYNFDWQSRAFFAPIGSPTVVPTAFACLALMGLYKAAGDDAHLSAAVEICEFIVTRLNRVIETDEEVCFSYTPLDREAIFNASLLAGEMLALVGAATGNAEYLSIAVKAARFAIRRQDPDGSWPYGLGKNQKWLDSFHTAYVLLSLTRIGANVAAVKSESDRCVRSGIDFWLEQFFLPDGTPKYYDDKVYPIDIHVAAVAIGALAELHQLDPRLLPAARRTAEWTVKNMRDSEGYFYYQRRGYRVIKTPFMRWGQAWMAYGLARLMETGSEING